MAEPATEIPTCPRCGAPLFLDVETGVWTCMNRHLTVDGRPGTPEEVAAVEASQTARLLLEDAFMALGGNGNFNMSGPIDATLLDTIDFNLGLFEERLAELEEQRVTLLPVDEEIARIHKEIRMARALREYIRTNLVEQEIWRRNHGGTN
jgi:hypothetical protein